MRIFIRLWNSNVIPMDVEATTTTRDVCSSLELLHGIPSRNTRLNEIGWPAREHQLAVDAELQEYDVQPDTVLHQVLVCEGPATLLLQDGSGHRLTIDVSHEWDVNLLRNWVDSFDGWWGIPPDQQIYFYRGVELMPGIPLSTYGIIPGEDVTFHKVFMRRRWPPSAPHHCNSTEGFTSSG